MGAGIIHRLKMPLQRSGIVFAPKARIAIRGSLDLHDFHFFFLAHLVHALDFLIGQLLDLFE